MHLIVILLSPILQPGARVQRMVPICVGSLEIGIQSVQVSCPKHRAPLPQVSGFQLVALGGFGGVLVGPLGHSVARSGRTSASSRRSGRPSRRDQPWPPFEPPSGTGRRARRAYARGRIFLGLHIFLFSPCEAKDTEWLGDQRS